MSSTDNKGDLGANSANCPACGGLLQHFGRRLGYVYFSCISCGTISLHPMPTPEQLRESYLKHYAGAGHYEQSPERSRILSAPYYEAILNILHRYGIREGVVDCGAGWGGLCETLNRGGIQCQGLEISEEMIAYCRERGLPVIQGDIMQDITQHSDASAFTLCAVFEHFTDPQEWLGKARQALRPGGLIVSLQPTAAMLLFFQRFIQNGNMLLSLPFLNAAFVPPWHTILFTFEGMSRLAALCGYELLETLPAPTGVGGGIRKAIRVLSSPIHRFGLKRYASAWPLLTSHIFVLQRL